jgi:hypothetical protein
MKTHMLEQSSSLHITLEECSVWLQIRILLQMGQHFTMLE